MTKQEKRRADHRRHCATYRRRHPLADAEYYRAHRAAIAKKNAAYRRANKEKVRATKRRHYLKHRTAILARSMAYYRDNKAHALATAQAWYRRNRARRIQQAAEWTRQHPEASRRAHQKAGRKRLAELHAGYIRRLLSLGTNVPTRAWPIALVLAKQAELKLKRAIHEQTKGHR